MKPEVIRKLEDSIKQLKQTWVQAIHDLQAECSHSHLAECDYRHSDWGRSLPPLRVCRRCGMSEQGWGPGYVVLAGHNVTKITRDELYDLRVGLMLDDNHKGALLRRETTVARMLKEQLDAGKAGK